MAENVDRFEEFFEDVSPRLRLTLGAQFGADAGAEAASQAMAYAWENWARVRALKNPAGYLYRVGQSSARRVRPLRVVLGHRPHDPTPQIEPELDNALASLTDRQRTAVLLVKGFSWTLEEVGLVLGVSASTVQRHVTRAMHHLRVQLGVKDVDVH